MESVPLEIKNEGSERLSHFYRSSEIREEFVQNLEIDDYSVLLVDSGVFINETEALYWNVIPSSSIVLFWDK